MSVPVRRLEVSRVIDAPAAVIFSFLNTPANHVALDASGMVREAAGPGALTGVGAVFVMTMHRAPVGDYRVENHVVVHEPARAIGWAPASPGRTPAGHTWTWTMTPITRDRTLVAEIYDWSKFGNHDLIDRLPLINRNQMRESLDRLAEAVTALRSDAPPDEAR
ncbi:SRPBCC family protein [Nocardia alni]|uniref:SRPBCC family protein n=1 Tax=Nocardia alni TaxID=2815723 RepID=UPI001C219F3C|nr:SRPBCC family protein [Nocardia alni]